MFNMNIRVSDSPLDAPQDFAEYCRQVGEGIIGGYVGIMEKKMETTI